LQKKRIFAPLDSLLETTTLSYIYNALITISWFISKVSTV